MAFLMVWLHMGDLFQFLLMYCGDSSWDSSSCDPTYMTYVSYEIARLTNSNIDSMHSHGSNFGSINSAPSFAIEAVGGKPPEAPAYLIRDDDAFH